MSWPRLAHFHHFSICNQNQSISISVIFRSCLGKIPRLQPYFLAKIGSLSSLFNLQSKSINFNFGHFSLIFGQNTKAIALLFGQNWLIFITFQSAIKINQFQFRSFFAHFWAKYQVYSLTFWPKLAHFHHFSFCNQTESISISVIFRSFVGKISKAIALLFGQTWLIFITFSICNQNQSISISVIFRSFVGKNSKAIALLFGQNWLIFITFQSAIKINQFQFRSFFAHLWAKYQGYSLTFWPTLAHFHHFSICNQNQSISISVIFR